MKQLHYPNPPPHPVLMNENMETGGTSCQYSHQAVCHGFMTSQFIVLPARPVLLYLSWDHHYWERHSPHRRSWTLSRLTLPGCCQDVCSRCLHGILSYLQRDSPSETMNLRLLYHSTLLVPWPRVCTNTDPIIVCSHPHKQADTPWHTVVPVTCMGWVKTYLTGCHI